MTPGLATLSPPCGEGHPLDESTLCRRLVGHSGLHSSDGQDAWTEPNDDDTRSTG